MKKDKVYAKVYAVVKKDSILNWMPKGDFTGALAIFENRKSAIAAIKYNYELMKIQNHIRPKDEYKIIVCEIFYEKRLEK